MLQVELTTIFLSTNLILFLFTGECAKQSFRSQLGDIEAVLGSTVVLPCEVNNQQGQVQWARHGFAMGEFQSNGL